MDRFQKVSWLWNYENRFMRENADFSVRFEDLVSDYNYFNEQLLQRLDLNLDLDIWGKFVSNPQNVTAGSNPYPYKDWSTEQKYSSGTPVEKR
jgi:hypothetical protein